MSVDSPMNKPQCGAETLGQTNPQVLNGQAYEGIRVVSIAGRANPRQVAFVDTDCGSHTHTLVPDETNNRVLIYVLSYPLGGQASDCNAETHRKISVVEVPLNDPAAARVVSTPDVSPAIGCHDVTVFVPGELAGAACISESQLWDISDPVRPRVVSHIVNPAINIHHSTTFSYRGFIYANNFDTAIDTSNPNGKSRGFDSFVLADKELKKDSIKLRRLNPQTAARSG